ncbi:DNA sulfur modification protein DndD [Paenibacillus sambharensis]|uniref:DNA sulfur modification protein DndD n=1 Tax=Paenibacillus sambharensis TaxID=1803190 RepID=A0A2W1LD82_9BACL|nr:DNA sulfur modification protein DndD [Paenibacillus sambharensis]PZD93012.1 DNA sulfur modification protein DndD [Paenibacillus sambharensis]
MQITKLLLNNIGAYYGNQNMFDFRTNKGQNVILLGGKNGAGKTTILESLRIVLFGSMAYGFVNENEPYFRKISSLLNRKALEENVNSDFRIILNFTSTEEFELNQYTLTRSWRIKGQKLKEDFYVVRNGKALSNQETSDFQNRLREEMPPRLFELCLFDGEDISRIVSEEKIPEYLGESGRILFNLDLFMNLEKDLQTYRAQFTQKSSSLAEEIAEQEKLEKQIADFQQSVDDKVSLISAEKDEISLLNDEIRQHKRDFDTHGGLLHERRLELVQKENEIENRRKANSERIRSFTNTILPFYIARELLGKVIKQLDLERENESFEYASSALEKSEISKLIYKLQQANSKHTVDLDIDQLHNGILDIMRPENIKLLHRASFEQRSKIHNIYNQIKMIDPRSYLQLFDQNSEMLVEAQRIRRAIELNDKSSEFKDLLEQIEVKTKRVEQLRLLVEQQEKEIQETKDIINIQSTALSKVRNKIRDHYKAEDSYVMTEKLLIVSKRFRERQWRKKLDDVINEATKMINILFRKKAYIERIYIDHATFELSLFDRQKQEITKERLSAGEKEMLMLTVIWAMFKVSGWKLPFVFDTLMGRLDQDHKKALIEHFIPKCGEQVLMFTTDSEITTEHFNLIKDITARCYTLDFEEKFDSVSIAQGRYFNMSQGE